MIFTIRRNDLLREIALLQAVVDHKTSIPILSYIRIEATDTLRFTATDLEVALTTECPANVAESGSVLLHAKTLFDLVKALPETDVVVNVSDTVAKLTADRFKSSMRSAELSDYPVVAEPTGETMTLSRDMLKEMVTKTFMTEDYSRHFLNGALLEFVDGSVNLASSDSYRLAFVTAPFETKVEGRLLLPAKTLNELRLMLNEGEGDVAFQKDGNHVFFTTSDRTLTSLIIDGEFPDFRRILNRVNDKVVEFEREKLFGALSRVALLCGEETRSVKFAVEKHKVVLSSGGRHGEAEEALPVDYMDVALSVYFNVQHVIGFLASVSTESVTLHLNGEANAAYWKPVGAEGFDYTYVMTPMRA